MSGIPPGDSPPEGHAILKAASEMSRRRLVVTSRAIYNDRGLKLLEGGVAVDASLYERLVAHRLSLPLDESLDSEPAVDAGLLRGSALRLLEGEPFFAALGPPGRERRLLLDAIESIPLPRPMAFQLTLLSDALPEVYAHSLQMMLLCARLQAEDGAPLHDIRFAAAAGLLHDLGMLNIDSQLLAPQRRLVGDERRPLYAHPLTGSMLVDRFHVYPREVSRAVLEHHERLDGSGYPRGLAGKAISPLGRVLSLGEVVTAMFDGRRPHPGQRVSLLLRLGGQRYDAGLVALVQRLLGRLPAPVDAGDLRVDEALQRLALLCDLVACWREQVEPQLQETGVDVLGGFSEQVAALQTALFKAGVTREQLARLTGEDTADATLRIELWALEQELQWHLRSMANQLQRRWRGARGDEALPAPLAEWLQQARSMEQGG